MNPRSCLRWKPTGRIFSNVRLRWIPTGKLLNSCTGKVDSEPAHGSIVDIPHIHACKQTLGLSAGTSFNGQKQQRIDLNADALHNEKQENLRVWLLKFLISKKPVPEWPRSSMFKRRLIAADQASVFMEMTSVHISSGLVLQAMNSQVQSGSKLFLSKRPATSRQELELLFHLHIAMLRTTGSVRLGINPMIQPENRRIYQDNSKVRNSSPLGMIGVECKWELMPTRLELTLEQSTTRCFSNDVPGFISQKKLVHLSRRNTLSFDISLRDH
ncbi:hypothetical protein Tco_1377150 [Tanacetum coccineum]